jgi:hypothetical protein
MPYERIDLSQVTTYPLAERQNLVTLDDLVRPADEPPPFDHPDLPRVADAIRAARAQERPVIWFLGAHVVKCGLAPLIIDLMQRGAITHVAGNGAVSIHDLELALIGETSEDVAEGIEDGSFGMADETGRLIHQAIQDGLPHGMGYGEAVGHLIASDGRWRRYT